MDNVKKANRVSVVSIIVNTVLSLFKLIVGIFAHSGALISDSIHSASDVLSTFAVIAGVNIAAKDSDKAHQYGHERMENIFSIILAILLFATGLGIGFTAVKAIAVKNFEEIEIPGAIALVAAFVSIAVKEWMYHYTMHTAKKIKSTALKADAWHHRSDALSSVGSFAGILGARMGLPICDPIASLVICAFIAKAAWDIFYEAVNGLVDHSADDETCTELRRLISEQDGVLCVDDLKTRMFGSKLYVDVEIGADGNQTLRQAHEIAQCVHDIIEKRFENVKHCMVHVNPK